MLPVVSFGDVATSDYLTTPVNLTFRVNMNGATNTFGVTWAGQNVYMNGNFLSLHYANLAFGDIHQRMQNELRQLQHDMTALMSAAMAASDEAMARKSEDYVISGERNLLNINDITTNMNQLRNLFNVFEQKTELLQLLDAGRHAPGVQRARVLPAGSGGEENRRAAYDADEMPEDPVLARFRKRQLAGHEGNAGAARVLDDIRDR